MSTSFFSFHSSSNITFPSFLSSPYRPSILRFCPFPFPLSRVANNVSSDLDQPISQIHRRLRFALTSPSNPFVSISAVLTIHPTTIKPTLRILAYTTLLHHAHRQLLTNQEEISILTLPSISSTVHRSHYALQNMCSSVLGYSLWRRCIRPVVHLIGPLMQPLPNSHRLSPTRFS